MELEFTEDQEELRDGVRTMLAGECPMSLVRAVAEGHASSTALWDDMVGLGWPALTVPEADGGIGLGMVELAVVVEELGRAVAPGPFLATTTQFLPVVRELGSPEQRTRFAGGVADGSVIGTVALQEPGRGLDLAGLATTATETADGFVLNGTKEMVFEATVATEVVVVAHLAGADPDAVAACIVPADAIRVEPIATLDRTRALARVHLDAVPVDADRVLGTPGALTAVGLDRALHESATALAVETVGTCQTIFDVTIDYAKQREQFGVPIGSFQALKHKFADMIVALEKARASAYFAALTIAEDDDRRAIASSAAKVAAADCERLLCKEGIQLHGGIGFTWEHDMHLFVRRAKSSSMLFGTPTEHRGRIAELLGL